MRLRDAAEEFCERNWLLRRSHDGDSRQTQAPDEEEPQAAA